MNRDSSDNHTPQPAPAQDATAADATQLPELAPPSAPRADEFAGTLMSPHKTTPAKGSAPPSLRLRQGDHVGRYIIESKVGEGGMGIVYLAHDPELNRRVALKLLQPNATGTEADTTAALQRMLREAQAMAQVNHPNLVTIFDVGAHEETLFIAMEYIEGETLESWIGSAAPIEEIFGVFAQAGQALQAIHDAGLVHRDFKPANVIVSNERVAKVLDLGIARRVVPDKIKRSLHLGASQTGWQATQLSPQPQSPQLQSSHPHIQLSPSAAAGISGASDALSTDLTVQGALLGTPAYMAPEQLLGETVGPASDQFAFAVALFQAITGARPFAGSNPLQLMANIAAGDRLPWPTSTTAPPAFRAAVDRALQTSADARHPSMQAFVEACRSGLGLRGLLAERTQRWLQHKRDSNFLLHELPLLKEAADILAGNTSSLSTPHLEFLRASCRAHSQRLLRRRLLIAGAAGLTAVAVPGAFVMRHRNAELLKASHAAMAVHLEAVKSAVLNILAQSTAELGMMHAQRKAWWHAFDDLLRASANHESVEQLLPHISTLNDYFLPVLERLPAISSIRLWRDDGVEVLFFDDPDAARFTPSYRYYNRISLPHFPAGSVLQVFDGQRPKARHAMLSPGDRDTRGRVFRGYDASQRHIFRQAIHSRRDEVGWSAPYLFYVTRDAGVTGYIPFDVNGQGFALSADFMLTDLSAITTAIQDDQLLAVLLTSNGQLVGLPHASQFKTPQAIRDFFAENAGRQGHSPDTVPELPPLSALKNPLLDAAFAQLPAQPGAFKFEFQERAHLANFERFGRAELQLVMLIVQLAPLSSL